MNRVACALGALLFTGCEAGDPSISGPGDEREPESYLPDLEVQPPAATLSADGVAGVVLESYERVLGYVPTGFPSALDALMAEGDPDCPAVRRVSDERGREGFSWEAECVASSGTAFAGSIQLMVRPPTVDDEGFTTEETEFYTGGMAIEAPDGRRLSARGYFAWNRRTQGDVHAGGAYLDGEMSADAATAGGDPWLSGEVDGLLSMYMGQYGGYRAVVATASLATNDPDVVALNFDDLQFEPGLCDTELLGRASLREANGVWHDLSFAYREETDEAAVMDCDGCALHLVSGAPSDEPLCMPLQSLDDAIDFSGGLPW